MKFSVCVAVLADELEERAIDLAREAGAGGITILNARGLGAEAKKTFFGLTFEGGQTVLLMVLEKKLSLKVMKALSTGLELRQKSCGVVFTLPLEHIVGIDWRQLDRFQEEVRDEL
ncbi:MAG: P-II family nitrogen regulator [Thioalkalivibrionaceae bacterium]